MLALFLVDHRARLLQQLERALPEMQHDDVALFRQEIVFDAQSQHRGDVTMDNRARDHRSELRRVALATLDLV